MICTRVDAESGGHARNVVGMKGEYKMQCKVQEPVQSLESTNKKEYVLFDAAPIASPRAVCIQTPFPRLPTQSKYPDEPPPPSRCAGS